MRDGGRKALNSSWKARNPRKSVTDRIYDANIKYGPVQYICTVQVRTRITQYFLYSATSTLQVQYLYIQVRVRTGTRVQLQYQYSYTGTRTEYSYVLVRTLYGGV